MQRNKPSPKATAAAKARLAKLDHESMKDQMKMEKMEKMRLRAQAHMGDKDTRMKASKKLSGY